MDRRALATLQVGLSPQAASDGLKPRSILSGYDIHQILRGELLALTLDAVQQREERWVIADVNGKAGHVCTVPIPSWVKAALDAWTTSAGITAGHVFRAINNVGKVWGDGMTPKVVWDVVREAAHRAGIGKLAPHDMRRTCARLCYLAGGELDRFSFSWDRCRSKRPSVPRVQAETPLRRQRHARH